MVAFNRLSPSNFFFFMWAGMLAVSILGGCRAFPVPYDQGDGGVSARTAGTDAVRLKDAVTAFRAQDYATAHDLFEHLSHEAEDRALRRQALYGLACVRLLQAQSPEEARRALNVWSIWEEQSFIHFAVEDPRLLSHLLQRLPSLLEKPVRGPVRQGKQTTPPPLPQTDWFKIVEEKDRQIQELQERLRALEAIHRELEEKRRGLTD